MGDESTEWHDEHSSSSRVQFFFGSTKSVMAILYYIESLYYILLILIVHHTCGDVITFAILSAILWMTNRPHILRLKQSQLRCSREIEVLEVS